MLYDIKNVGRDGVGAAMACRHGVVYRVDVLQAGKSAKGKPLVEPDQVREYVGRGVGLAEITVGPAPKKDRTAGQASGRWVERLRSTLLAVVLNRISMVVLSDCSAWSRCPRASSCSSAATARCT